MSSGPVDFFTPLHRRWLKYLTVSTVLLVGLMLWLDAELRTKGAPLGMISLELAGGTQPARLVINAWTSQNRIEAAFELGFDFLCIGSYALWIYLGCLWSADRWQWHKEVRAGWIRRAAWFSVAAGGFDIIENIVLFDFIHSAGKSPAYPIAFWCALLKFLLLAVALVAFGSGLAVRTEASGDSKKPGAEKRPESGKK